MNKTLIGEVIAVDNEKVYFNDRDAERLDVLTGMIAYAESDMKTCQVMSRSREVVATRTKRRILSAVRTGMDLHPLAIY